MYVVWYHQNHTYEEWWRKNLCAHWLSMDTNHEFILVAMITRMRTESDTMLDREGFFSAYCLSQSNICIPCQSPPSSPRCINLTACGSTPCAGYLWVAYLFCSWLSLIVAEDATRTPHTEYSVPSHTDVCISVFVQVVWWPSRTRIVCSRYVYTCDWIDTNLCIYFHSVSSWYYMGTWTICMHRVTHCLKDVM